MNEPIFHIGFPRMHLEPGERRDFLPKFMAQIQKLGAQIYLEHGYGSGMGFGAEDYRRASPEVQFSDREEIFQKDYVLVLRYPGDQIIALMKPGGCLISMLHYPTRPQRVNYLRSLGLEAISLDSLKDDTGRRLVENLRAVAWNGMEAAYQVLRETYPHPGFDNPGRPPVQVTLLGAGAVGVQVVQAAIRYADDAFRQRMIVRGVPGVRVNVVDYDLTNCTDVMKGILSQTDILVDATQRRDASIPVIPNEWIAWLPRHAVLLDLSVDPYDCDAGYVKGIEGIPQGNLDQYIFTPDDPAYALLPACIPSENRRYVVSCYSWPGVHPQACMDVYGKQIQPILRTLIERGGLAQINPQGKFFERAISRSLLSRWS